MEIQEKAEGRTLSLLLSGEVDHHGVRDALRRIEFAMDAALPKSLILDFSAVQDPEDRLYDWGPVRRGYWAAFGL